MKILKFGGSSVATPQRIKAVIEIVRKSMAAENVAVVFSAFGGVTDQLIELSELAFTGQAAYQSVLSAIERRHLGTVRELITVQKQSAILAQVKFMFNELEDILHGVFLVRERTQRTLDYIMSFGERLSAYIISEGFNAAGIDADFLDARAVIRTDSNFGHAKVRFDETTGLIRDHLSSHTALQIITGFIGTSATGETTTLGRSGSDYTAAIFAGALDVSALEIWTDVDGMMTADPRQVKKAFTVGEMTYEEAMELSHFGAKVIFPSTMQPVMAHGIPIWIKNTFNPSFAGTRISAEANGKSLIIKGISSMSNISLLSVQGSGLVGVVGVSMRLFATLAREQINVILISQASSEHSICFAVEAGHAGRAKQAIETEFKYDIAAGGMDNLHVESDLAIVAIVGENMKDNPGTSGRMFSALGKNGINVSAIAQGSSELNISAVVRKTDVTKALHVLHEAFFLSDRNVLNLFLAGTGLIGKTLVEMIADQAEKLARESKLEINIIAVANSTRMLFDEDGLPAASCIDTMKSTGEPMSMPSFLTRMTGLNLAGSVFVDCTSSEEVTDFYEAILSSNISIVSPNKKANSGSQRKYIALKTTAARRGVRFLYETNVGAGLPVINTMNDLLLSGDRVLRIEAVLSGTLNFIFSSFTEGRSFREVVQEAKERGYTEPDPRDDLNGADVARKTLILAREIGLELELNEIEVENLVPENCRTAMSLPDFFQRLGTHDSTFEKWRAEAAGQKQKLRYMAILENGKVHIRLAGVGQTHPFYSLEGSDNIILLTTARYNERPMVIRGPGAGATVTAAGVFADVIRIGKFQVR